MENFEKELRSLLNRHCKENESNTPDFILASFLLNCLAAFNVATRRRDETYNSAKSSAIGEHG